MRLLKALLFAFFVAFGLSVWLVAALDLFGLIIGATAGR